MTGGSTTRRRFLERSSSALAGIGVAAATRAAAQTEKTQPAQPPIRKGIVISMLPSEMSFVDRFKLAAAVGFQGIEAQTVKEPETVAAIKEASAQAGIPIHSVMNMDHWKYPLSSSDRSVVETSMKGMQTS